MQFDRKTINRILSLSDAQLESLIRQIGSENGIDLSSFRITATDASSIRKALSSFSDSDITRAAEEFNSYQNRRKKQP